MNTIAQPHLNSSAVTTLPTPPTDDRRSSPSSYPSMSTSALLEQPRRHQTDSLPSISLPQVSRPYSPSGSNLGGNSLPTPPPNGENYPSSSSLNNGYSGYQQGYNSQSSWPTSAPQHSQQHYSLSMSDQNPQTNSPSGSYRGMSPSTNTYPIQPVSSAYNTYGGSPHSPPSRDSRNNSPYQGEYLPAPQGAGLYSQPGPHQGSDQAHYQSYPPTNLPPLQHGGPMMSQQHAPQYQSSNSPNGSPYNNYFQYGPSGAVPENSSTLPPPLSRAPLPPHMSHQYQPYPQPPSSYPSSQPYGGGGGGPSSNWRFTSPPSMHASADPNMRNSQYSRPMMRPGNGGIVVNNQDRPFKCDQCPQSFNRNHDLKRHKRIHLAVKPFPCPSCDKSFSRKDALKRHILVKGCGNRSNDTSQSMNNANIQE